VAKTYPALQRMMENPRNPIDNETMRRYYATAFFFIKQEFDLFKAYVIALSIKIDLSYMGLESVRETIEALTPKANNLMSELTIHAESNEYGFMSTELRDALDTTSSKTQKLLEGAMEVSSRLEASLESFEELKKFSEIDWLEEWTILSEKASAILNASPRGLRGQRSSCVNMVKILYEAFKLCSNLLRNEKILSFVSRITNNDKNILEIEKYLNSFEALISLYRKNYDDILEKQANEAQTSCYALIESMTPTDTVIYENIALRKIIDELHEAMQGQLMELEELE